MAPFLAGSPLRPQALSGHPLRTACCARSLPKGSFDSDWGSSLESFPTHSDKSDQPSPAEAGNPGDPAIKTDYPARRKNRNRNGDGVSTAAGETYQ
jgi:hypothetical protein